MSAFDVYSGQEVASGIRPNEPVVAFETAGSRTVLDNLATINGLIPKISKVLVRETRIRENPLDQYFRKFNLPYGVGMEEFQFSEGAINKKNDGGCIPHGNPAGVSQIDLINLAWSFDVSIFDREIDKAVLGPEEVGQYVAQKMRTIRKSYAALKMEAQIQLISDVIDGTRSVSSTTQSDGNGTSVTYAPTITGYAGEVDDTGIVLAPLAQGTIPTFASAADGMTVVKKLQNAAAEMRTEGTSYSKLGISTFTLDKPICIMESKVLNALDNSWALDGSNKQIPTRTAREFISTFADLCEIPKFAELPTNANYTDVRLAAVLLDRDSLSEGIVWEDIESARCHKERMTGYNLGGASAMAVYRGNPAYALLTDTQ